MAPEQFDQEADIDERADLFSLGCVLFFTLTGKPPFDEDSRSGEPRDLKKLAPKTPSWMVSLIEKLLRKTPDKRPQSAAEVATTIFKHESRPVFITVLRWIAVVFLIALAVIAISDFRPSPPAAFQIENTGYGTLEAALSKAQSGDSILIHKSGTVSDHPLDVGERDLTISAAPGHSPVFTSIDLDTPVITHRGKLVLEGLTIALPAQASKNQSAIQSNGGSLFLLNCWLTRPGITLRSNRRTSLLTVDQAERIVLRNTEICTIYSAAIRLMSNGTKLHIENSSLLSEFGIVVSPKETRTGTRTEIQLYRSAFLNNAGVIPFLRGNLTKLDVELQTSFILSKAGFLWVPSATNEAIREHVHYLGKGNVFSSKAKFLNRELNNRFFAPGDPDPEVASITEWQSFWSPPTDTDSLRTTTEYEESISPNGRRAPELVRFRDSPMMKALTKEWPDKGPERTIIGPGASFEKFHQSAGYTEWKEACESH